MTLRGGSWNNNASNARAAFRNHNAPDNLNNNIGFRLVLAGAGMLQRARPVNPHARLRGVTAGAATLVEPARSRLR